MTWPQNVRAMAKKHAVGGCKRQRVAGALLPGQVFWPLQQLAVLNAAELRKRTVRRLIAPDALARRKHRIAAVALFIVAIVLIAVDDDFIADLPALDL